MRVAAALGPGLVGETVGSREDPGSGALGEAQHLVARGSCGRVNGERHGVVDGEGVRLLVELPVSLGIPNREGIGENDVAGIVPLVPEQPPGEAAPRAPLRGAPRAVGILAAGRGGGHSGVKSAGCDHRLLAQDARDYCAAHHWQAALFLECGVGAARLAHTGRNTPVGREDDCDVAVGRRCGGSVSHFEAPSSGDGVERGSSLGRGTSGSPDVLAASSPRPVSWRVE